MRVHQQEYSTRRARVILSAFAVLIVSGFAIDLNIESGKVVKPNPVEWFAVFVAELFIVLILIRALVYQQMKQLVRHDIFAIVLALIVCTANFAITGVHSALIEHVTEGRALYVSSVEFFIIATIVFCALPFPILTAIFYVLSALFSTSSKPESD